MAEQRYSAGQAVAVYETAWLRAEAEHHGASYPNRLAIVARAMPQAHEGDLYEVTYTDAAGGSAIVPRDVLLAMA